MTDKRRDPGTDADLRQRAEARTPDHAALTAADLVALSPEAAQQLLHELQGHQLAAETQNEELRRTQLELETARARYFDLYDLAPVGYVTVNEAGLILEANLTIAALLGVDRGALRQQPISRFVVTEDQDIYYRHRQQLIETAAPQVCEVRMRRAGAAPVWVRMEATTTEDGDGAPLYRAVVSDITAHQRAEAALRESDDRYFALFERSLNLVYIHDLNGRFIEANDATLGRLGYTRDELRSLDFASLLSPDQLPLALAALQEILETGTQKHPTELRVRHKDGREVWIETQGSLILSNGVPEAVQGVARDVTERKLAEERARLARQVLDCLNRPGTTAGAVRDILRLIKDSTGFEAVGIRLREGEDFPYYETNGFPDSFVELERSLCARDAAGAIVRDARGRAFLECMCGNILCGRTDPTLPFFTAGGSFWSNCTTDFLASTTEKERQTRTRNRCNSAGYESVALIPLRVGEEAIGLLQLNDHRRNQFTPELIRFFEDLGASIGIALARRRADAALRESEARFRELAELLPETVYETDSRGVFTFVNRKALEVWGYTETDLAAGLQILEMLNPEDRGRALENMRRMANGQDVGAHEYTARKKDGSPMPVLVHSTAIVRDGQPAGLRGIILDLTERQRMETAIRDLAKFPAENPNPILRVSRGGILLYANPAGAGLVRQWGVEVGQPIPEHSRQLVEAAWAANAVTTEHVEVAGRVFEIAVAPIREAGYANLYGRDITERKRAEEALRASEAMLARTEAVAHLGSWAWDVAADRVIWSEELFRLFGIPPGGSAPSFAEHSQLYHPDDQRHLEAAITATITRGTPFEMELRLTRRDGEQRVCLARGQLITPPGSAPHLAGSLQDITARKQVEEALRASETKYRAYVENTHDVIVESDRDGRISFISPQVMQCLGYTPDEVVGTLFFDLLAPGQFDRLAPLFAEALAAGSPVVNLENVLIARDGRRVVMELSTVPFFDSEGTLRGFRGINRDVTQRNQLLAAAAQADRLASMGMLAAGVAHEINNPLAYVLFNVESLAEDLPRLAAAMQRWRAARRTPEDDAAFAALAGDGAELLQPAPLEDAADRAREALEGAQRIREIVRGLGLFSRVERVELAPVDLNAAIEHAATMAQNEIRFRARLVKDLGPVPAVWASEGKVAQVFLNLLVNAAHAIDEGDVEHHRIGIRTWAEGPAVLAEVTDTGKGIPPENLGRVFEPFFTTKKVGVGSGLGLAICRSIVIGFNGDIRLESQVGKGTRVVVRLPVAPAAPEERPGPAAPAAPLTPSVVGRILIVDDEATIRTALQRLLGRGHEVVTAASGAAARAILERDQAFDLILCDLMMPEMSGMDLHAWLATHDADLAARVVFISGGAFTPRASEYVARVGNLRVEKPFDAASLAKLVAERVAAAKSRQ